MTNYSQYISTRGGIEPVNFEQAVFMGLAPDGGLLLPKRLPNFSTNLQQFSNLTYQQLALTIIKPFIGDAIPVKDLEQIINKSYQTFDTKEIVKLKKLGSLHLLELFHGPTLAFKDLALQFLGNIFAYFLQKRNQSLNIIAATSGDTGSAAIAAVAKHKNIKIFVMYPFAKVSPVQEKQMNTIIAPNVFNIAISGSFDDGQNIMKNIFADNDYKEKYNLGAVNSVNWTRVLAQIVYYFYAYMKVIKKEDSGKKINFSVPTGNFGDIFAGYIAKKMGLPVNKLIVATNENNILSNFFNTNIYKKGKLKATTSPSMDIQVASNFERYLYYNSAKDSTTVKEYMKKFQQSGKITVKQNEKTFIACSASNEDTITTIKKYYEEYKYILDPHTAVGIKVAEQFQEQDIPTICLATAHPAKFNETITIALGKPLASHQTITALKNLPTRSVHLNADITTIKNYLQKHL